MPKLAREGRPVLAMRAKPTAMTKTSVQPIREWFARFSRLSAASVGSYWAFITAAMLVLLWAASGPLFHFSDTWQLIINTTSSIATFLMVFLIQSTQNRDTKAINLKLDELIRSVQGARNDLVLLEDMSEEGLDDLAAQFARLRDRTCRAKERKSRSRNSEAHSGAMQKLDA